MRVVLGAVFGSVGAVFGVFDRSYLLAPLQTPVVEWSADFLRALLGEARWVAQILHAFFSLGIWWWLWWSEGG